MTARPRQLALALPNTWGGARKGAGRKPKGEKAGIPHRSRLEFSRHHPLHVTVRMKDHVWNLRSRRSYAAISQALENGGERERFRVVHFSIQGNHVHLLVEAESVAALYSAMRGLDVRLARALNKMMGRKGAVFADRYHARVL